MKNTYVTESKPEPLFSLVWTGLWIVALAVLLLLPAMGR
jgi:hypothetical protein